MNKYNNPSQNYIFSFLALKEKEGTISFPKFSIVKNSMKFICEFVTSVNHSKKIVNRFGYNFYLPPLPV